MDMDIDQVDQAIEGDVSVGWFQSKEDLHAEAVRLQEAGRYQEALVAFLKYRNALGKEGNNEETVETADMYSELGQAHVRQGKYSEAEEYYAKEKNLRIKLLSASDISFGRLYNNVGRLYELMARYPEALEVLEKAFKINKAVESEGVDVANTYHFMGNLYYRQGKYDEALQEYGKSLAIYKSTVGEDHPDTQRTKGNIQICKNAM